MHLGSLPTVNMTCLNLFELTNGLGVGVSYPRHLTLTGAHVRCRHVNAGSCNVVIQNIYKY